MVKHKACIGVLVLCVLTGCSTGLTPYAESLGIRAETREKDIDSVIMGFTFGVATFVRQGVLTEREATAERALEVYNLQVANKSEAYRMGFLRSIYREFPEAQNRRRLCRGIEFDPEGWDPRGLVCKGVKYTSIWVKDMEDQQNLKKRGVPQQRVPYESQTGALPPDLPSPPSSSQYTVFGPDGKMQICNTNPATQTVFCY